MEMRKAGKMALRASLASLWGVLWGVLVGLGMLLNSWLWNLVSKVDAFTFLSVLGGVIALVIWAVWEFEIKKETEYGGGGQ